MMNRHGLANDDAAAPTEIMHPSSRSLFAYWDTLRGERPAPQRHEIELRSIRTILPWVGVLESDTLCGGHRWRLAGTGIARLWGRGLTGSIVAADWPELSRRALLRALDGVSGRQQPFVARLKAVSETGEALGLEFTALPVTTDDGTSTQVLCAVVPFRTPLWLGTVPLTDIEIRSLSTLPAAPLPGETASSQARSGRPVRLRLLTGGRA